MTSWLEYQKMHFNERNTRRRRFVFGKTMKRTKLLTQSNPIQSMDESNPCSTLLVTILSNRVLPHSKVS